MIDPWRWWGDALASWCGAVRAWTDWCGLTQPAGRCQQ